MPTLDTSVAQLVSLRLLQLPDVPATDYHTGTQLRRAVFNSELVLYKAIKRAF